MPITPIIPINAHQPHKPHKINPTMKQNPFLITLFTLLLSTFNAAQAQNIQVHYDFGLELLKGYGDL